MSKLKNFYITHKEIVLYLVFGVLTTLVGWAVYFSILLFGKSALGIAPEQIGGSKYFALYSAAQVIQWIAAVLFAFFTNRRWVFCDADKEKNVLTQLSVFAAGRLATFGLDYLVTYFGAIALSLALPTLDSASLLGMTLNLNEIGAKIVAAVIVIIGNYFFSKLLVFRKKGEELEKEKQKAE